MDLEERSTKELLELHNALAETPAGPKTFSTKAKLIARLRLLAATKKLDHASAALASSRPSLEAEQRNMSATGALQTHPEQDGSPKRGIGVGDLARKLLMDPLGYPHAVIASLVNAAIPGASTTAKSVRWYACKMRKMGAEVPPRAKVFPGVMDAQQSAEWLKTVSVVVV